MIQSLIRYVVLGVVMWLVGHGVFSKDQVTAAKIDSITNDIIAVGIPAIAILWSYLEKKIKGVVLPGGDTAVIIKKALPVALLGFAMIFGGCAAQLSALDSTIGKWTATIKADLPGWETGINALWTQVNKKSAAVITYLSSDSFDALMASFKVNPKTAANIKTAATDANGDIAISQNLLNLFDMVTGTAAAK